MTQGTGARVPDAAIPATVALALHLRTLAFGLVDLDDRDLLVDDRAFLASPGSVWRAFGRSYMGVVDLGHAYFRPIVTASYALDTGPDAGATWRYHLTNVILHCVVAALACEVLRTLRFSRGASVAAACVIAVHPALVPAVAWIPGRNDGLLAVFGLAAWLAFARGAGARWTCLHLVCFAAALFTKETAFVIPLVCVAHATLAPRAQGGRSWPACIAGWTLLAALRLAVRRSDLALAWGDPAAVGRVFLAALEHLVLPVDPAPIYASSDLRLAPGIAAAIALAWAASRLPGVRRRIVVLGAAVFVAFVLPVAIAGGTLFLDNRLLLPAVGVAIAVFEIGQAVLREMATRVAMTIAVVLGLAAMSAGYEGAFAGPRPFALAAVAGSPRCALAHVCLGRSYQGAGEDDRALGEYEEALRLAPAEIAHNNIAVIYMKRGQWDAAARELDAELALNPGYARAYFNRAIVLRREGRPAEACAEARRAVALSSIPAGATCSPSWRTIAGDEAVREGHAGSATCYGFGWLDPSAFRALVENAPDGVVVSRDGIVLYANHAAAAILGYGEAADLVGKPMTFLDRQAFETMRHRVRRIAEGERLVPREYPALRRDGTKMTAEIASTIIDFEGKPAVLAYARDVTERARLRGQLAHADRLASLGTMAAGVAHEINNPLTFMALATDSLARRAGQGEQALVQGLRTGIDRIAAIVRDLRSFGRGDEEAPGPIDLGAAIDAAERLVQHEVRPCGVLVKEYGALPPVVGVPRRIEQVFVNLLLNAVHAFGDRSDGRIVVRAEATDERVAVTVEDDGVGIPAENLDAIFEPFFTTRAASGGTGLGLSICRDIVVRSGGELRATSVAGKGTSMVVTLVRAPGATVPAEASEPVVVPAAPELRKPASRRRVLVVDDETAIARLLSEALEPIAQVTCETTSRAALDLLLSDAQFDVVLCDVMMPGLTGIDLHERVARERPELASRFVFMSGGTYTARARDHLERVSNPRLDKPFRVAQLIEVVERVAVDGCAPVAH